MSRQARKVSSTGIYHVFMRGNNKQQIFLDEGDNERFMAILKEYSEKCGFSLLAYCLMGNHIHLLIKVGDIELSSVMKRIVVKFVYHYNVKYGRMGHLFQDRFGSEVVETDEYLLQAVRYIHQNPVKAGLCKSLDEYKYSSFNEYFGECEEKYCDTELVLDMVSGDEYRAFHDDYNTDYKFMDIQPSRVILSDEEAIKIVEQALKRAKINDLLKEDKDKQRKMAAKLRDKGLSVRQITRLTGITKHFVESRKE